MATFNKFEPFVEHLAEKIHNLGSDVLKVMLTNTLPVAANGIKTDVVEIAAAGGYAAGGTTAAVTTSAQAAGVYKLVLGDVVFTGTAGGFGPFRAAVLYNSTAPSGNLIGWWNYGSSISIAAGETFTVDFDPSTGVLTIT